MTTKITAAMVDTDVATQAELDAESATRASADATNAAAAAAAALKQTGDVVQLVMSETGAVATGTTTIPLDDTIPQNTEGDQYLSLAITPTNVNNKLVIEVAAVAANSAAGGRLAMALFQDTTANALAAVQQTFASTNQAQNLKLIHTMTAGTTSATTFKVRIGANNAGTTTLNGEGGSRQFGGVMASTITITEIKV